MRLLLLLSALLTSLVGLGPEARASVMPAAQISALAGVAATRAGVAKTGSRPVAEMPSLRDVVRARALDPAPMMPVPLYANRLRT